MKGSDNVNIVIIGTKTKNGMRLLKNTLKVIQNFENKIELKTISDHDQNNYGIKNVPALIVDGKIKVQGKVLSEREIHRLLTSCV